MDTIGLFIKDGVWQAKFSDKDIISLFGTDTLPTAFSSATTKHEIRQNIKSLNPDCLVYFI